MTDAAETRTVIRGAECDMDKAAEAFRWLARCLHLFHDGGRRWQRVEQEMFTTGGWGITKFDPEVNEKGIRTAPLRSERRAALKAAKRAAAKRAA